MRQYYIDKLRFFLTILVIFHHTAIAFGASGGWYYVSPTTLTGLPQMLFSAQMAINQAYFMSFFFFISALFLPGSYSGKGFAGFLKGRLIRLGIPLVIYVVLIHPSLVYVIMRYTGQTTETWFNFLIIIITKYAQPGPMWFVVTLLFFELLYVVYKKSGCNCLSKILPTKLPTTGAIILFIIIMGLITYALRLVYAAGNSFFGLQFGYFPLYIAMYVIGILCARNNWLSKLELKTSLKWFIVSLVSIFFMLVVMGKSNGNFGSFMGGLSCNALFYAMWEPVVCVGFCYFLLALFKKYFNRCDKFIIPLSKNSYGVYIIHPVIVVLATIVTNTLEASPIIKLLFVLVISVPLCFLITWLLRKLPFVKKVL